MDLTKPYAELWCAPESACIGCHPIHALQECSGNTVECWADGHVLACARMGTHPSGPSIVSDGDRVTLKEWIAAHPGVLGDAQPVFGLDLPFLFKVTSTAPTHQLDIFQQVDRNILGTMQGQSSVPAA